jgi:glycosyltransferase involved in cell wall biosynthesis
MKVVVTLASTPKNLAGVPRHAVNLIHCLLTRREFSEVHLVAAPWQLDFVRAASPLSDSRFKLHSAHIGNNTVRRNLWFYNQLPVLAQQLGADLVHLAYPVPVRSGAFKCPTVVTLHDLYPYDIPENFGFPKVLVSRAILRQCLRKVDAIACVSQFTLSRLQKLDDHLAEKASVIPNSVEREPRPEDVVAPVECSGRPFVLCVAQHRRNKNIPVALRAFGALLHAGQLPSSTQFLLVGNQGPETPAIRKLTAALGLSKNIFELTGISDAQLQWCYRNCCLLVAPSEIEGFGLPVAEALLAGCRVVCSDIPAFHEIGNGYCKYSPLGSQQVTMLADAMRDALNLPLPIPISLPKLSPQVVGQQYLELYRAQWPAQQREGIATHAPYEISTERPRPL